MAKVMYVSDESWQTFKKGNIYDVDFNYYAINGATWFVFIDGSPISWHGGGRTGYLVNEHKKDFQIMPEPASNSFCGNCHGNVKW